MTSNGQLSTQFIKTDIMDPIDTHINLRLRDYNNNEIVYRTKRTVPLKQLKEAYSKRNGPMIHAKKFIFDGLNIRDDDTPDSLEMEEGDSIHVMNIITSDQQFIKTEAKVESRYRIRRNAPLGKLMQVHCERNELKSSSLSFLFDGCRIKDDYTPDFLGMEDNDIIDHITHAIGC
ncbi:small ubiquitin-related modifier 1-like [Rhizophagus clarus]|uniref:Small ubiquitin-related modifier 1-like n=1 Tax=Rhizophagus clarus TaxID=94130 RepID=A0A8H3KUW9_9GLOM|nr:small ubiquitin-related modifier 1-like [Rhizophagus clarus]